MTNDPLLRDLRAQRDELAALLEPLERGKIVSGDAKATEALIIHRRRELEELDALIAREEARNA